MSLFAYSQQGKPMSAKVCRAQPDEYVVKFYSNGKHLTDANYFTDDKEDAINTAKYVVDNQNK